MAGSAWLGNADPDNAAMREGPRMHRYLEHFPEKLVLVLIEDGNPFFRENAATHNNQTASRFS
jgi:hypothetical protein